MDLRLPLAEATEAERAAIDEVVGPSENGNGRVVRADRGRRNLLLPALRAAQRSATRRSASTSRPRTRTASQASTR